MGKDKHKDKSYKILLKNTSKIRKMFKGVLKKGQNYRMSTWLKVNVKIYSCP